MAAYSNDMVKRLLIGFVTGVAAGVLGYWYFDRGPGQEHFGVARDRVLHEAGRAADNLKERFSGFATNDIREELARTGTVVREKAQAVGQAIGDATANARITAAIKAKLLAEPGLSSLQIHVVTSDGLVTLAGRVDTLDQLSRAVKLAVETDGVLKVISTLQVELAKR